MSEGFPRLLREHRARRRWSQEHLALEAGVSPRHLSCMETGKARPSREMVVLLASTLDLDLRERNALLVSAGFAAMYPITPLEGTSMAPVSRAIDLVLSKQEPYGALLIDRCWNVLRVNEGGRRMLSTFLDPSRVPPGVMGNLARATLHPDGLRSHIGNWHEAATILLDRMERAHHAHPLDEERLALLEEVRMYPGLPRLPVGSLSPSAPAAVLTLRNETVELKLFALLTTIGTPLDVTAQDLTIETFYPVDATTERWFRSRPER